MASRKRARAVVWTVTPSARRAMWGGRLPTIKPSVNVRVYYLAFPLAQETLISIAQVCLLPLLGNICTCENGVAQTGVGCVVSGAAKCQSCNTGFTTNHARTECIRTWVNVGKQSKHMIFTTFFFVLGCSEYVHMQEWRRGNRRVLSCGRRCQV